MTRLHPSIASIEHSYRAWLKPEPVSSEETAAAGEAGATEAGETRATPPSWVADLIRRQVAARPQPAAPAPGDLVVLSPGHAPENGEDGLPLVMLLDDHRGDYWSGWIVGAHPDYAGSQDLVLERALLADGRDPSPLAAMVQTWNRIHRHIDSSAQILHRLTDEAMAAVRELSLAGIEPDVSPQPGRMHLRRAAGLSVITGTPYGRHDPRDGYLLMSRELAAMVSEPLLERSDRERGDGEPDD
ncbi:MAG: hypothetical protein GVY11_02385 [Gammaproteobacteria bacterium]|jgi:hypothetical protein|nr:hypothetical protein [Gammaproteobacteria bacterium]